MSINRVVDEFIKTDDNCYLVENNNPFLNFMTDSQGHLPKEVACSYISYLDCYKIDCDFAISQSEEFIKLIDEV